MTPLHSFHDGVESVIALLLTVAGLGTVAANFLVTRPGFDSTQALGVVANGIEELQRTAYFITGLLLMILAVLIVANGHLRRSRQNQGS